MHRYIVIALLLTGCASSNADLPHMQDTWSIVCPSGYQKACFASGSRVKNTYRYCECQRR